MYMYQHLYRIGTTCPGYLAAIHVFYKYSDKIPQRKWRLMKHCLANDVQRVSVWLFQAPSGAFEIAPLEK